MKLDRRIKRLPPHYFRFGLTVDDVIQYDGCYLDEVVGSDNGVRENVIMFTDKLIVPWMVNSKYNKVGVEDWSDLVYTIKAYLCLNPNINKRGIAMMADYINRHHILYDAAGVPSFDEGDVRDECFRIREEYPDGDVDVKAKKVFILYENFSELTPKEKTRRTIEARRKWIRRTMEEVVDEAAQITMDSIDHPYMITDGMIKDNAVSIKDGQVVKLNSINTLRKYMGDDTITKLELDGKYRYISLDLKHKLDEYMDMDDATTVRDMVKKLQIGNNTALKFRRWRGL